MKTILPYELRIGVTGHRKLKASSEVAHAVEKLLEEIETTLQSASEFPEGPAGSSRTLWQRCERFFARGIKLIWWSLPISPAHTPEDRQTPLFWRTISPLAKGADRIVARAVLKRPDARLEVITPFPANEYRRDFKEEEDRAEFEELYAEDPSPLHLEPELGTASDSDYSARRNEGYFEAGRRVIDSSEIVIAIWNGQPAGGRGGTGDVVQYAVEQGRVVLWIDSENPSAEARQITDFKKVESDEGTSWEPVTESLPKKAKELSPRFHRLSAYNRDAAYDPDECVRIADRTEKELRQAAEKSGLPKTVLQPILEKLIPHYARADQLAICYQQLYVRSAMMLHGLAAFAVTVVVAQVLFFPDRLGIISLEIGAMVLAVLLLRLAQREAWHEKWLNDRHLAERLRTVMFTVLLGKTEPLTASSSSNPLPFYQGPEGWFVGPFQRILEDVRRSIPNQTEHLDSLKRFLITSWISSQASWHAKNATRKRDGAEQCHRLGMALFVTTLVMASLHLIGVGHEHGHSEDSSSQGHLLGLGITFLAISLPAWGAAVHAVNTLLDRERIAERSERMAEILQALAQRAKEAKSTEQLRREISRAEEIMAAENQEWLASLTFQELVLPV